uniref:Uncharacterized protein n=1 Tax=Chrysotila carterae TaxID=13221 RepID=A0A7S4F2M6_CHRCT|eukprot:6175253-Pleurochrysis_carterae.AAC.1
MRDVVQARKASPQRGGRHVRLFLTYTRLEHAKDGLFQPHRCICPRCPSTSSIAFAQAWTRAFRCVCARALSVGWSDVSDSEMADEGEEQPATSDVDTNDANDDDDDDDLFEEQLAAGMES